VTFHLTVLVDGALTGALYAPIALSFVIVYRASGMINFALGEWTMLAAALVAGGKARDFKEGVALAAQSIDSGAAAGKLAALVAFSQRMSSEAPV